MKTNLLFIIMISALVSACVSSSPIASGESEDECIPPLYSVAFPVVTHEPGVFTSRHIPPQGNWQIQDALPFPQDELSYLGIRPKQHELWFMTPKSDIVYRYFIDHKQWKTYQAIDSTLTVPYKLFIASDGTVWGAGIAITDDTKMGKPYPLLSRFNDATDRFEFVADNSGLLQIPQARLVSNITEDQSGLLWFFVEEDKQILSSFDVKTGQVQQHYFKGTGGNSELAIGPDGSVWFGDVFKNQLIQYIPSSQETRIYKGYPEPIELGGLGFDLSKVNYLYFDHSGRLWLANYGWLNFSENNSAVWNRVLESPVFITEGGSPLSQFDISYQYSTYQSSNDWYWFTGGAGIVRLDLQEGSWCLMTTGVSDVVEDNDRNLWIAVFGHLYKYPLEH